MCEEYGNDVDYLAENYDEVIEKMSKLRDSDVLAMNKKTGKLFIQPFESPHLCRKYVKKCSYSKDVIVLVHPNFD